MRRILVELLLFVLSVGGCGYAWWTHRQLAASESTIANQKEKLTALETERRTTQARMPELLAKEGELDAVRRALSAGPLLQEVEAMIAGVKTPTAEQILGLAALRLLVKGKDNPDTAAAFQKALDLVDWPARLNSLCAAQAGMALAGTSIRQLAECEAPPPGGRAPEAGSPKG